MEKTGPSRISGSVSIQDGAPAHCSRLLPCSLCVSESLWHVTSPPGPHPTRAMTTTQFRTTGELYRLYECIIGHRWFSFWKNEMQPKCPMIGSCACCAACRGKDACDHSDSTLERLRRWKHTCNIPVAEFKKRKYQKGGRCNILSFKNTWNLGVEWPLFGSSGTEWRTLEEGLTTGYHAARARGKKF